MVGLFNFFLCSFLSSFLFFVFLMLMIMSRCLLLRKKNQQSIAQKQQPKLKKNLLNTRHPDHEAAFFWHPNHNYEQESVRQNKIKKDPDSSLTGDQTLKPLRLCEPPGLNACVMSCLSNKIRPFTQNSLNSCPPCIKELCLHFCDRVKHHLRL